MRFGPVLFFLANMSAPVQAGEPDASPTQDRAALWSWYENRFPSIDVHAHRDGVYAQDEGARAQWLEIEDFPPYEFSVDEGRELFAAPLAAGENYAECLGGTAVKQQYPHFDETSNEVVTLELAINRCRKGWGLNELAYDSEEMINLTAFIAYESRGQTVAVTDPNSEAALAAYQSGKAYFSSRRGQLNFACLHCHMGLAGNRLRAERLSASIGHVTHWPVYRLKWQELGPLHRRFQECNSQVGGEALPLQSKIYRELEYFLTVMNNGMQYNGPATRK